MFYFAENPRLSDTRTSDHYTVYPVTLKGFFTPFGRCDVAVTDNGDMHAWVFFYGADERPVGLAGVHLCTCASVDREGCNAAVLQLLGQFDDNAMIGIPAKTRLYRYGNIYGFHYGTCYLKHQREVA